MISKKLLELYNYIGCFTVIGKNNIADIKSIVRKLRQQAELSESLLLQTQQKNEKMERYYINIVQKLDKAIVKLRKQVKRLKNYRTNLPEL